MSPKKMGLLIGPITFSGGIRLRIHSQLSYYGHDNYPIGTRFIYLQILKIEKVISVIDAKFNFLEKILLHFDFKMLWGLIFRFF